MAKLVRKLMKVFGTDADTDQRAVFGSLAQAVPAFTTDVETIQSLAPWQDGWFAAILGGNSPAIEDMNSFCFVAAYQLAYLMQTGTPEWNAATTYFKGSIAQDGNGVSYMSLTDTNLNHAVTDRTNWLPENQKYDVIVGAGVGCTHATFAAALADSALTTNVRVLLKDSATLAATIAMSKAGWQVTAAPGVTYTAGVATTAITVTDANCTIQGLRFSGFTIGIAFSTGGNYGRVLFCNFATTTTDVDTTGVAAAFQPAIVGSIDE